jgi:hypothetical protein
VQKRLRFASVRRHTPQHALEVLKRFAQNHAAARNSQFSDRILMGAGALLNDEIARLTLPAASK